MKETQEILFKFETAEERNQFQTWFSEYGQYSYSDDTGNSIQNVDIDTENHIINVG